MWNIHIYYGKIVIVMKSDAFSLKLVRFHKAH